MSVGKYSPTINNAYHEDPEWFYKVAVNGRDPSGYDSYGYDKKRLDRAGNTEEDYYLHEVDFSEEYPDYYLFDKTISEWNLERILKDFKKPSSKSKLSP